MRIHPRVKSVTRYLFLLEIVVHVFVLATSSGAPVLLHVLWSSLQVIKPGHTILVEKGGGQLTVQRVESNQVVCKVDSDGKLGSRMVKAVYLYVYLCFLSICAFSWPISVMCRRFNLRVVPTCRKLWSEFPFPSYFNRLFLPCDHSEIPTDTRCNANYAMLRCQP